MPPGRLFAQFDWRSGDRLVHGVFEKTKPAQRPGSPAGAPTSGDVRRRRSSQRAQGRRGAESCHTVMAHRATRAAHDAEQPDDHREQRKTHELFDPLHPYAGLRQKPHPRWLPREQEVREAHAGGHGGKDRENACGGCMTANPSTGPRKGAVQEVPSSVVKSRGQMRRRVLPSGIEFRACFPRCRRG